MAYSHGGRALRGGGGSSRYACCNAKAAGDILYLPIGVFHRAWPHKGHNSVHIAVAFDHKRQNWRGLASLALQKVRVRVRAAAQQEKGHSTVELARPRQPPRAGAGAGPRASAFASRRAFSFEKGVLAWW